MDELRAEKDCVEDLADSPEATEQQLEQCTNHRDLSIDSCISTIMEGETLLQELRLVSYVNFAFTGSRIRCTECQIRISVVLILCMRFVGMLV